MKIDKNILKKRKLDIIELLIPMREQRRQISEKTKLVVQVALISQNGIQPHMLLRPTWAHSILVVVVVWLEKKLKKGRIRPAVEKVVEMVTEKTVLWSIRN